jgi:hypothetical protein
MYRYGGQYTVQDVTSPRDLLIYAGFMFVAQSSGAFVSLRPNALAADC